MYIRLNPGHDFDEQVSRFPGRKYNQLLPIAISKEQIFELMPAMKPTSWMIYTVLLWYESVKFEISTPTLEKIYYDHLSNSISKEDFDLAIEELENLVIKNDKDDLVYLVKLNKKSEGAE